MYTYIFSQYLVESNKMALTQKDLELVDQWISKGDLRKANRFLGSHFKAPSEIPHDLRLDFLYRAWLAECHREIFTLLFPVFNPGLKKEAFVADTSRSRQIYGSALLSLSASQEALRILRSIPSGEVSPSIANSIASAYLGRWDFKSSQQWIEKALARAPELRQDEILLAQIHSGVNRLLGGDSPEEARGYFDLVISRTAPDRFAHLGLNALFWKVVSFVYENNLRAASKTIEERAKWIGLGAENERPLDQNLLRALVALRKGSTAPIRAVQRKFYFRNRICEYWIALFTNNAEVWRRVYVGSPYPAFKAQVLDRGITIPDEVFIKIKSANQSSAPTYVLDLVDFEDSGSAFHRLLLIFFSDLYRDRRITEIHELLFQTKNYHPVSGPTRVHQIIFRFRRYLKVKKIPLKLESKGELFGLEALSGLRIRMPTNALSLVLDHASEEQRIVQSSKRGNRALVRDKLWFSLICETYGAKSFSAKEVAEKFSVAPRTMRNFLLEWTRQGRLETVFAGKFTQYRVKKIK